MLFYIVTTSYFCLNINNAFLLPYDIPAILFTFICIYLILNKKWLLLHIVFAIATINRETSFLILIFLSLWAVSPNGEKKSLRYLLTLSTIWIVIKFILFIKYAHLPTEEGIRLFSNITMILKPWQWPALLPLFLTMTFSVITYGKFSKLRPWSGTTIVGFLIFFMFAVLAETRAFGDLIPYFLVSLTPFINVRQQKN